jgi:hypothetical protein
MKGHSAPLLEGAKLPFIPFFRCEFRHRADMKALLAIFLGGGFPYDANAEQAVVSPVTAILRWGQDSGEFRAFDPKVMATLVQRAVDGLPFLLAADPGVDPVAYGAEVATTFDLATRAGQE